MEHVSLKSRHAVFWVQLGLLSVEPRLPGVEPESWRSLRLGSAVREMWHNKDFPWQVSCS